MKIEDLQEIVYVNSSVFNENLMQNYNANVYRKDNNFFARRVNRTAWKKEQIEKTLFSMCNVCTFP